MSSHVSSSALVRAGARVWRPELARFALVMVMVLCAAVAFTGVDAQASAAAARADGPALARLMRFMAGIKSLMALGAAAAVMWRLGVAASGAWLAAYAAACGAMAAGPVLIWGLVHVGLGALLLHGGLLACVVMLWRDPAVGARLAAVLVRRLARG
jgi:hypothetical protein